MEDHSDDRKAEPCNEIEVETMFVESANEVNMGDENHKNLDENATAQGENNTEGNLEHMETENFDEVALEHCDEVTVTVELNQPTAEQTVAQQDIAENDTGLEPSATLSPSTLSCETGQKRLYKSYFVATTFKEIAMNFENKTVCLYCDSIQFKSNYILKEHIRNKHYTYAVFCLINNKRVCIFPCRKNCDIVRSNVTTQTHNFTHYHCPLCKTVLGKNAALKQHLQRSVDPRHSGSGRIFILDAKKILAKEREDNPSTDANDLLKNAVNEIGIQENEDSNKTKDDDGHESDGSLADIRPENLNVQFDAINEVVDDNIKLLNDIESQSQVLNDQHQSNNSPQEKASTVMEKPKVSQEHKCDSPPSRRGDIGMPTIGMLKKIQVDGIEKEDQIFAASLAVEMKKLNKKDKMMFKMKVLTFLHEGL